MERLWRIFWGLGLLLMGLGVVVSGLALLMNANLVRIADAVFAGYDMVTLIEAGQRVLSQLTALLPF